MTDEEWRAVEQEIMADPRAGAVMRGSGGIRKLRAAKTDRGKRGGARVLYLYMERRQSVYVLLAYAKNVQEDVSPDQREQLRRMAVILKGDDQ